MPGKKISRLGSNLYTNNTCCYGSMAGLNSTVGVRSWITGMNGYKYSRSAANGVDWVTGASLDAEARAQGCGLDIPFANRCSNGATCLLFVTPPDSRTYIRYDPVRSRSVLG